MLSALWLKNSLISFVIGCCLHPQLIWQNINIDPSTFTIVRLLTDLSCCPLSDAVSLISALCFILFLLFCVSSSQSPLWHLLGMLLLLWPSLCKQFNWLCFSHSSGVFHRDAAHQFLQVCSVTCPEMGSHLAVA